MAQQDLPVQHQYHQDTLDVFAPLHHRTKPGRMALLQTVAWVFQILEDQVYDAYVSHSLPFASGKALDFWGWLAGVPRQGLTDRWYRPLIQVAFQAKRSNGDVDALVKMWQTGAVNPLAVEFTRYKKNLVILTAWRTEWLPEGYAKRLPEIVLRGCPTGSVVLLESLVPFVGDADARDYYPLPSSTPSLATGAKVWWPPRDAV